MTRSRIVWLGLPTSRVGLRVLIGLPLIVMVGASLAVALGLSPPGLAWLALGAVGGYALSASP